MKKYALPKPPYGYFALEPHYSARLLELHHGKHHAAYVAGANATLEKLAAHVNNVTSVPSTSCRRTSPFTSPGTCCTHSWRNMSPQGGGQPTAELTAAIQESFGSFDASPAS